MALEKCSIKKDTIVSSKAIFFKISNCSELFSHLAGLNFNPLTKMKYS